MASVLPSPSHNRDCIMLNHDPSLHTPVRRLTIVEKARLEAMAAFGNEDFNSLSVKKDDFHSKLKSSATKSSSSTTPRPLTRLEIAKMEANTVFKNINLGQKARDMKKRTFQESNGKNEDSKKTNLTRLQKAKAEVDKAFENVSLAAIPPKKSRIEKEKMETHSTKRELKKTTGKEAQKVEWDSPCQPHLRPRLSNSSEGSSQKRLTRSLSAKLRAMRSSEEKDPVERLGTPDSHKKMLQSHIDNRQFHKEMQDSQEEKSDNTPSHLSKSLTRFEKAKLEAMDSFSGQQLDDICKQSTRILAKYLKPKKQSVLKTQQENACTCVTPRQTPSSHRNEAQSTCKPDNSVYSSITEGNFKDHHSLLETSKRVIETAVMLETPEKSPMPNNQ